MLAGKGRVASVDYLPAVVPGSSRTSTVPQPRFWLAEARCARVPVQFDFLDQPRDIALSYVESTTHDTHRHTKNIRLQTETTMASRVHHFKLVLLGDTAVGKSCLVVRFVRDEFFEFQEPTIGGG